MLNVGFPTQKTQDKHQKPLPELSNTCSGLSPPVNTHAQWPLPSQALPNSLGTRGPFVVRGVPDLSNLEQVLLLTGRSLEIRVPMS